MRTHTRNERFGQGFDRLSPNGGSVERFRREVPHSRTPVESASPGHRVYPPSGG